jgi:hypothetical protein
VLQRWGVLLLLPRRPHFQQQQQQQQGLAGNHLPRFLGLS